MAVDRRVLPGPPLGHLAKRESEHVPQVDQMFSVELDPVI